MSNRRPSSPSPGLRRRPRRPPEVALGDLAGPLLVSLLAGDEPGAERALAEARGRGADLALIVRDIVTPALAGIGEMWVCGDVSVAEEHLATSTVARTLARLSATVSTPPVGSPRILFACLAGEFHDLGARLSTDVAREAGWDAECLGANVPRAALVGFVAQRAPRALALSLSLPAHVPECARTIREVRAVARDIKVVVGGSAFAGKPELARLSGADAYVSCTVDLRDWLGLRKLELEASDSRDRIRIVPAAGPPAGLPEGLRKKIGRKTAR